MSDDASRVATVLARGRARGTDARDGDREAARDGDGEAARDGDREAARDGDREAARDGDREAVRDGDREAARDTTDPSVFAAAVDSLDERPTSGAELGSLAQVLGRLADAPGADASAAPIAPGMLIDRVYRVERAIGEGGMGVVYRARDVRLDRDVAVKVGRLASVLGLVRLEREAAALARLSHPNVVVIYQVGAIGERVYLAMEYVRGGTARTWLTDKPRSWREIVALYAAAGDGLAAAHEAGLIHRDFKPDNVLVGDDGRPRVADFGLAREDDDAREIAAALATGGTLTQAGAIMGTPAYMPPEQLAGEPIDARADQFAFCASLWEALYGVRPFDGRTPEDVAAAIASAPPRIPTGDQVRRVPRHIARALRRGLAADRRARFPSMPELLRALRLDPARWYWRTGAVVALAAVAGGAVIATRALADADDPCAAADQPLAAAWSSDVRDRLQHTLTAAGIPPAGIVAAFDGWAERWRHTALASCHASAAWSSSMRDRAQLCLAQRRQQMHAAVRLLVEGDRDVLARGAALTSLDAPETCGDPAYLDAVVPPLDAAALQRSAPVRDAVARARALRKVGKSHVAAPIARAALTGAIAAGDAALEADARAAYGDIAFVNDDNDTALRETRAAYFGGLAHGATEAVVAAAATRSIVLADTNRSAESRDWEDLALAGAARTRDARLRAVALHAAVVGAINRGERDRTVALANEAVALLTDADRATRARALLDLSLAQLDLDAPASALTTLDEARRLFIEIAGLTPAVDTIDTQRANALRALGKFDEAIELQRAILARREAFYGPRSESTLSILIELGGSLCRFRPEEAMPVLERSLALARELDGARSYRVGVIQNNMALAEDRLGHPDRAMGRYHETIATLSAVRGPQHPIVGKAWSNLGSAATRAGQLDVALDAFAHALDILERVGPESDDMADALTARGSALLARGDGVAALRDLERAVAIRSTPQMAPQSLVLSLAYLAWAQSATGSESAARATAAKVRAIDPDPDAFPEPLPAILRRLATR